MTIMLITAIVLGLLALAALAITAMAGRFADVAEGQTYGTTDPDEIARQRQADRDHLARRRP